MSLLRLRTVCLQRHRIVIPTLPSSPATGRETEEDVDACTRPHPQLASFLDKEAAEELRRQRQLQTFKDATEQKLDTIWRDSKSHLRKQAKLVAELGLEGAVHETLQPTRTSFRSELRQRPLDRAIMEEIYKGLHGKRIERHLKRGVSWEHWITKGDGTAPVYTTASKTQQLFAFGGHIVLRRAAAHPRHFPVLCVHGNATRGNVRGHSGSQRNTLQSEEQGSSSSSRRGRIDRAELMPEVAFIGRTASGKSSLVNALVNAMISPYGHLPGNTDTVRFYSVAERLMLVDCPGYGYYHPVNAPVLDAENAVRVMRAYLMACRGSHSIARRTASAGDDDAETNVRGGNGDEDDGGATVAGTSEQTKASTSSSARRKGRAEGGYQPRNIKRVFLCVPARGLQHMDIEYCNLLERLAIPFSVVLTKTDRAPIRFLARLTDYTRCQLVQYKHCKELMLTSALRLAGIDKMQNLIAGMAAGEDATAGATMDFDSIV